MHFQALRITFTVAAECCTSCTYVCRKLKKVNFHWLLISDLRGRSGVLQKSLENQFFTYNGIKETSFSPPFPIFFTLSSKQREDMVGQAVN